MSINSINTNIAAMRAQENIGIANRSSSSSIARLSSGERIVRASDDVASMSAGTSLRTNVTTLRTALINASQGTSMLQVADGALNQITDILLRQKAISVQAGSGSLSASERSFLNQEFQNLTEEVDRIASQTNFNGVNLLDGSVLSSNTIETDTETADQAVARFRLINNPAGAAAGVITINGFALDSLAANSAIDLTLNDFELGATVAETVENLLYYLQNTTARQLSGLNYALEGTDTIVITSPVGGIAGETFNVATTILAANATITSGAGGTLAGGRENGLRAGAVTSTGTIGDAIAFEQNQDKAIGSFQFTASSVIADGDTFDIGGLQLTVRDTPTVADETQIQYLADGTTVDVRATIDELVAEFNRQRTTLNDYELSQVMVYRDGLSLVVESSLAGAVLDNTFNAAATGLATSGATTIVNATLALTGTRETGVNTNFVNNEAFVGTVSGFTAEFVSQDRVNFSIVIGERTYEALNVNVGIDNITDINNDLGAGAETRIADLTAAIRFKSAEGDSFTVDFLGADQNITATDQDDADDIAGRLDAALSTLTFYQERDVANFTPLGGSSASIRLSNFDDFTIGNISVGVAQSETSNASVEFTAGGETFRAEGLGANIRAGAVLRFVSTTNSENYITYQHGQTDFDLATTSGAESFEEYLRTAFQVGADGTGASFQVGTSTSDTLKISIGVASTTELFGGASINVLTQEAAATAGDVIDAAIDSVTSIRATVGALQSRFDFASANIESSLQNQDAARAVLLDTDIAAESTAFATAQVQLQAGISVLAQANLLSQNLLKLIG